MTLSGVDLSKYQASTYKNLIASYGKDFVIVRAAWRFSVDPYCDQIYQYAKSQGKKLGFYAFPLTSDGEPEKHAEWFYQQVLGYIGQAIPVLDWESYNGSEGKNDESKVDWAKRWLDKFYALSGVKPMIYMNSNCNSLYDWTSLVKADYGLWIANYGKNNGTDNGRPFTKYWPVAAMHQFTSTPCDRDTFYGDKSTWDAYAKSNKVTNPAPSTPEPTPTPTPSTPAEKTYTQSEVDKLVSDAKAAAQKEVDAANAKASEASNKLTTCENVVENAKNGINGILNYKK